jgi:hypothetical protein
MRNKSIYSVSIEVANIVALKNFALLILVYNILLNKVVMEKGGRLKIVQSQYCRISLKVRQS